jgi:hypothetical protein
VEIPVGARTIGGKKADSLFARIADLGYAAASPASACAVVLLPGATLTFGADAVQ